MHKMLISFGTLRENKAFQLAPELEWRSFRLTWGDALTNITSSVRVMPEVALGPTPGLLQSVYLIGFNQLKQPRSGRNRRQV